MQIEDFRWLAAAIAAHKDGKVVGNTRLQKEVWLLQRLGLPADYSYMVHFYGPYSEGLQSEIGLLESLGIVEVEEKISERRAAPYYITKVSNTKHLPIDQLPARVKAAIPVLEATEPVVLELAATYDAFRDQGNDHEEAMRRVKRKKGNKCDGGNLEKALALLERLDLKD